MANTLGIVLGAPTITLALAPAVVQASPGTPTLVGGWTRNYDASDAASLTLSGSDVTSWGDLVTTAGAPKVGVHTLNGKNVVTFAGAQLAANIPTTTGTTGTWFGVIVPDWPASGASYDRYVSFTNGANPDWSDAAGIPAITKYGGNFGFAGYYNNSDRVSITAFTTGVPYVVVVQRNGDTMRCFANGVAGTTASGCGTTPFNFTLLTVGGVAAAYAYADIAQVTWYTAALSDADIAQTTTALMSKWGVAGATGNVLGITAPPPSGLTLTLSPAAVTTTARTVGTTVGAVSVALTKATATTFAVGLGVDAAGSTSRPLTKASVTVTAVALGAVTVGPTSVPLTRAVVTTTGVALVRTTTTSFTVTPATVVTTAVPVAQTAGATSVALTRATVSTTALPFGVTFTAGKIQVWNGSAWVYKPVKWWNGTAWAEKPLRVWTGTTWKPPSWSPANLPQLRAWWDASDLASITATAGKVSQWADKSGNGFHAVQGTGANQPLTGTRTVGGTNVIDCSTGAHFLTVTAAASTLMADAAAGTIFVVFVQDSINEGAMYDNWGQGGPSNHHPWSDNNIYDSFGVTSRPAYTKTAAWNNKLHVYTVVAGTTTPAGWYRAFLDDTMLYENGPFVVAWDNAFAARLMQNKQTQTWVGAIGAIIVCAGDQSAMLPKVREWVAARWMQPTVPSAPGFGYITHSGPFPQFGIGAPAEANPTNPPVTEYRIYASTNPSFVCDPATYIGSDNDANDLDARVGYYLTYAAPTPPGSYYYRATAVNAVGESVPSARIGPYTAG